MIPHHKAYFLAGGQPLQELAAQLVAQDTGLAQATFQGLLILLAGVRTAPGSLEDVVDDAHDVLPQAAVEPQHHAVVLKLHLGETQAEGAVKAGRREAELRHAHFAVCYFYSSRTSKVPL